jgi:hypothetical protein
MDDYSKEKWVGLYNAALLELEHALVHGRIGDTRREIAKRLEALSAVPGLHGYERGAIQDALANLRVIEREEVRYAANEQRRLAERALERLRAIRPSMERRLSGSSPSE